MFREFSRIFHHSLALPQLANDVLTFSSFKQKLARIKIKIPLGSVGGGQKCGWHGGGVPGLLTSLAEFSEIT